MAFNPQHGHAALRRGRWSCPGATYFLTFVTEGRQTGLESTKLTEVIWRESERLEEESRWRCRCGVVMPDHAHLIVELAGSVQLADAVRLFKGRLAPALRRESLSWQKAYFDHRLRAEEDLLSVFLYVFLNPYRAKLLARDTVWPGYRCASEDWVWFEPLTAESRPMPEWLA